MQKYIPASAYSTRAVQVFGLLTLTHGWIYQTLGCTHHTPSPPRVSLAIPTLPRMPDDAPHLLISAAAPHVCGLPQRDNQRTATFGNGPLQGIPLASVLLR